MAADINDLLTKVNNGTIAEPAQLSAAKATSDTSASLTLATGWPTDTAIHIVLFKTETDGTLTQGSATYWKATLTGTTLSNMALKGGTNQAYATGDSVLVLSPYVFNDIVEHLLTEHNQDGTHRDVTATTLDVAGLTTTNDLTVEDQLTLPAGSIETADIAGSAVTPDKLALGLDTSEVSGIENTTSTSYTALATAQAVTVTVPASGKVLVMYSSFGRNTGAGTVIYAGCELSGANTQALGGVSSTFNEGALQATAYTSLNFSRLLTGLTPGSTTFTMKFATSGGTGSFSNRRLIVIPLA